MGADLVGMSTVPECIAAVHAGLRVCALSIVTDRCDPDHLEPVKIESILKVAAAAAPKLEKLLLGLLSHA
jgi:purine-nucleoside phosphorylase